MIVGLEQRITQKLHIRVTPGNSLKLRYVIGEKGNIIILSANKVKLPDNLSYAKIVEGTIDKRNDKDFAFLKSGSIRSFISPLIVKKHNLKANDKVKSLIVWNYDKKKNNWNWASICVVSNQ